MEYVKICTFSRPKSKWKIRHEARAIKVRNLTSDELKKIPQRAFVCQYCDRVSSWPTRTCDTCKDYVTTLQGLRKRLYTKVHHAYKDPPRRGHFFAGWSLAGNMNVLWGLPEYFNELRNDRCAYCGHVVEAGEGTLDHIIPGSWAFKSEGTKQGYWDRRVIRNFANFTFCCKACNFKKSNKSLFQFMQELGKEYIKEKGITFHENTGTRSDIRASISSSKSASV